MELAAGFEGPAAVAGEEGSWGRELAPGMGDKGPWVGVVDRVQRESEFHVERSRQPSTGLALAPQPVALRLTV